MNAGLSQQALATAIGKSRQIIGRYEAGTDAPSVDALGSIALVLAMAEVSINGYKFSVQRQSGSTGAPIIEQLRLDFGREYVFQGTTLKITPTKMSITITAIAPLPIAS